MSAWDVGGLGVPLESVSEAIARGSSTVEGVGLVLRFHASSGYDARIAPASPQLIGEGPELEMIRFLAAAGYRHLPALAGRLDVYRGEDRIASALALASRPNAGEDGRAHLLRVLDGWLDEIAQLGETTPPKLAANDLLTRALFPLPEEITLAVGDYVRTAALLGARIGEMHKLLSRTHIEAFEPEPLDAAERERIAACVRQELAVAMDRLSALSSPPSAFEVVRGKLPSIERRLLNAARAPEGGVRIRIHGDLRLEQVRFTGSDFVLFDRPSVELASHEDRKAKRSPIVDVASMLRSVHSTAITGLRARPTSQQATLAPWVALWHRAAAASFLGGWMRSVTESTVLPSSPAVTRALLDLFLLDRIGHELHQSKEDWIDVPLDGIRDLLETERKPGQTRTSRRFTPFVARLETTKKVEPSSLDPRSPDFMAFKAGTGTHAHRVLGAHPREGGAATEFAVWAPSALQVAVIGDFNDWSAEAGLLTAVEDSGVFAGIVRGAGVGAAYQLRIVGFEEGPLRNKADPFGHTVIESAAGRGHTSAIASLDYAWGDERWMAARREKPLVDGPISVYEVDLGASPINQSYRAIATSVAERAMGMGFTHVELAAVLAYPENGTPAAPIGFFAPASRHGTPQDLMFLVDTLHQAGLGVILSWAPGAFARDDQGLTVFDGGPTFEPDDPMRAVHPASNTGQFDFARAEVCSFLLSSATFWIEQFHADGLRIDGLSSVLYRDYRRAPGTWSPNAKGGRESLEGAAFLRRLTETLKQIHPDVLLIADDPAPALGFDLRWDTSFYHEMQFLLSFPPNERAQRLDMLTHRPPFAPTETLILGLSDEDVGTEEGRRVLYTLAWAMPGKKVMSMQQDPSDGIVRLLADLGRLYRGNPALHAGDRTPSSFAWIDTGAFVRRDTAGNNDLLVAFNLTNETVKRTITVPSEGSYRELLNSDAPLYGGEGHSTLGSGSANAIEVTLAPLSALLLGRA